MYYRKIIKIKAEDSPNVKYAMAEIKAGRKPSNKILVPGVVDYSTYMMQRETYDEIMKCVGLDAEWYVGPGLLLYPPTWIDNSARVAAELTKNRGRRKPTHLGIDPAEGGDNTCMAAIDRFGLIELVSKKTPDTNTIFAETLAFIKGHSNVEPENIYFDTGGGGKQHADRLRANGYDVNVVAFGETLKMEKSTGMNTLVDRLEQDEESYIYKNRKAEMYGLLSEAIDPGSLEEESKSRNEVFALPKELLDKFQPGKKSLRFQLSKMPKLYDGEGRLWLPPKTKKNANSKEQTIVEMIGHSPDEADAVVLAVYGLKGKRRDTSHLGVM